MSRNSVSVAVISTQPDITGRLNSTFEGHPRVDAFWSLGDYPWPHQMEQFSSMPACVLFLDYTDGSRARAVAAEVDRSFPGVVTIAVHPRPDELELLDLMKVGVREVAASGASMREFQEVFARARRKLLQGPEGDGAGAPVFAFLPARPGSGATTLAVHASAAAARRAQSRTLLIDFDLRLGMTSFILKLGADRSVLDALSLGPRLDETLWDSLVNRRGMLDILGSAPIDFSQERPEAEASKLLQFVRQCYAAVCVDLPGELRGHEVETLHQAQEIFLVCTPQIGNLHMARRKADALRTLELLPRVSVIVNRANEKGPARLSVRQIEDVLGVPVRMTFPFADAEIAAATRDSLAIEGRSAFAKQIERLCERIATGAPPPAHEAKGRKFIDFFSISEVQDRIARR